MDDSISRAQDDAAGPGDDVLADIAPVSNAVFRVARLHKMLAGQLLRRAGLYPNQELVLMRLWTDGPQRQVDLVRMLESEAPTMTRTVRRLEKAGLVATSRSPDDRRVIIVEATDASDALRAEVEQAWTTLESWTVGRWSSDRRAAVLKTLAELESHLAAAESDAAAAEGIDPRR